MRVEKFEKIFSDSTSKYNKIKKEDYNSIGEFPIIDQGQNFIGGFTDNKSLITNWGLPVIVFGDHTKIFKYVDFPFAIGADGVKVLTLKDPSFNTKYYYFFLRSLKLTDAGYSRHYKFLKESKLPLPINLSDQLHIANLLSKAENLISQRKQSIALLDEFLKSTFLEMFGDNSKNDKGWKRITLIEACSNKHDVKCGPFGTQLGKSEYQIDGVPVWGIPQINSQFKILPKDFVTNTKALELDEYSVIPFDIVMSRKGNVGKCSLFPKDFPKGIIHSDVLRIRTDKKKMISEFLLFQLKFSKHIEIQINSVSKGAIMAGINVGKLKHIIIQLPPFELQTQFAQIVEKTEALKAHYQKSLTELENLFGSLSQKAFKGELPIKNRVNP